MTSLFIDANVLIDILTEQTRPHAISSSKLFAYLVENIDRYRLYTSCDLFTTIYYVLHKSNDKKTVLKNLKIINGMMHVIEFGNKEIDEAIYLMEKNESFSDLEDTIQFVMARKERCDYIVSNDKGFYSHKEIPLLSSADALELLQKRGEG